MVLYHKQLYGIITKHCTVCNQPATFFNLYTLFWASLPKSFRERDAIWLVVVAIPKTWRLFPILAVACFCVFSLPLFAPVLTLNVVRIFQFLALDKITQLVFHIFQYLFD